MKYSLLQFSMALLLGLFNPLLAQESASYSLEIHAMISEYGNTLGPVVDRSVAAQWPDWKKVSSGEGDYHIRVDFLEGLEAKQYHREKLNRRQYIYNVKYVSPSYTAIVKDKNGMTLLQKNYGGEVNYSVFGADDEYASPDTLADSWKMHREIFYELEENKYNNIDPLLADLSKIMNEGAFPIREVMDNTLTEITDPVPDKTEMEEIKEEVVLAIVENEKVSNNTSTKNNSEKTIEKTEAIAEVPETPNNDLEVKEAPVATINQPIKSPEPYTQPETTTEPVKEEINSITEEAKIDPATGRVAGETPPVPEPQKREVEKQVEETVQETPETDEDRAARLARIQAEWDEMEKEEEEQNKKPRVRYFRLGLRTLVPNLAGGHGEIVLPILNNRISLVGDFSQFNFGRLIEPFLTGESGVDNIDVIYRYYSVGANYYFRKKYARGWYLGGSYLKGLVKTEVQGGEQNNLGGQVDIDAGALRLGVTTGRKTFFFGFEIGAAVPLGKLDGVFYSETDGVIDGEVISERIPVLPILNVTLGVAL